MTSAIEHPHFLARPIEEAIEGRGLLVSHTREYRATENGQEVSATGGLVLSATDLVIHPITPVYNLKVFNNQARELFGTTDKQLVAMGDYHDADVQKIDGEWQLTGWHNTLYLCQERAQQPRGWQQIFVHLFPEEELAALVDPNTAPEIPRSVPLSEAHARAIR